MKFTTISKILKGLDLQTRKEGTLLRNRDAVTPQEFHLQHEGYNLNLATRRPFKRIMPKDCFIVEALPRVQHFLVLDTVQTELSLCFVGTIFMKQYFFRSLFMPVI